MAWLPGYAYRKPLVLTGGASGAQTDFQRNIDIAHVAAKMQADFDDIRFTRNDGTTLIDAWLESKVDSASAKTWAEFPTTPANTVEQTYYMYYGKVVANYWDGAATFEFFDDIEDNDTSDWTKDAGASFLPVASPVKIGSYAADHTCTTAWAEAYKSVGTNLSDRVFEFYSRVPQNNTSKNMLISKTGGDPTHSIYVAFRGTGDIQYYDGAWQVLQAYSINTWYRFKITTHPASNTFDIDIDGVNRGTGLGARGSIVGGINAISFMGDAGGHEYIDMIFMRKYAANPPTYAFGSEESAPIGAAPMGVLTGCFGRPFGGII